MKDLFNLKNKTIYSLGLMSGTSLDGIDIALVKHTNLNNQTSHELISFKTYPYNDKLKQRILKNSIPNTSRIDEICSLNKELGIAYKEAMEKFMNDFKIDLKDIFFIAIHGQTVYHIPRANNELVRSTLQLGDMSEIAYHFNKLVVYDFRSLDISSGGEGAPLVPIVNFELFKDLAPIMLLNIGGISNITYIKDHDINNVLAFDSGPGNMLIDGLMKRLFNKPFDEAGNIASMGKLNQPLFKFLMNDEYYKLGLPKSTGREKYNDELVEKIVSLKKELNIDSVDIIYTLTYFTAYTIKIGVQLIDQLNTLMIVSGGGARNNTLVKMLKDLGLNVKIADKELKIDSDALEAYSFAILGYKRLMGEVANVKGATGSPNETQLGSIILPPRGE